MFDVGNKGDIWMVRATVILMVSSSKEWFKDCDWVCMRSYLKRV